MELPERVGHLARGQLGVASRRQLLDAGVTPAHLRWQLGRTWRLLLPGVVLLEPGLPREPQRQMAALLYAGADAWLSGPTAAAVHRLRPERPGASIHVLVPAPRRPGTWRGCG